MKDPVIYWVFFYSFNSSFASLRIFLNQASKNKHARYIKQGGYKMVGRILNRAKYLWIIIIIAVLLLGVAVALLIFSSRSKEEIPQKGVFVFVGSVDKLNREIL